MRIEKWIIYAILSLILIVAAFNMVGALTMLVLEKKQDISVLHALGADQSFIQKIFFGTERSIICHPAGPHRGRAPVGVAHRSMLVRLRARLRLLGGWVPLLMPCATATWKHNVSEKAKQGVTAL